MNPINTLTLVHPAYLSGGTLTDPVTAMWKEFDPKETKQQFLARFDQMVLDQWRSFPPDSN